jgi:hypothetical protein
MAKRAGICFTNCSKIGVSCTRLLATGPMGLFYKLTRGGGRGGVLRPEKCVSGHRSTKLGTQSALISQPVKYCAT